MEEILYESKPYLCAIMGALGTYSPETFGRVCGVVLALLGFYIWKMRKNYRSIM